MARKIASIHETTKAFTPEVVTANSGTTSTTFAGGADTRITGAAQKASNLSDLASAATARTNLGLGTAATTDATAYARPRSRCVWAIGDSITAGDTQAIAEYAQGTMQGGLSYGPASWVTWAMLASGCRWTLAGIAATGGYTAAQILATHVPAVIAAADPGDTVVVLAGSNGRVLADVQAIHAALREAGLHTIAATIPPSTGATSTQTAAFNAGLLAYAAAQGIPIADVHSSIVDRVTGAYVAAYTSDGVHPTESGARLMGYAIAAALTPLWTDTVPLVSHNAAVTGQAFSKPLALDSPAESTDYTLLAGIGTGTVGPAANAAFAGGQGYKFLRGDTNIAARLPLVTLVAGHRYRIGFAWESNGASGAGVVHIRLESNTTGVRSVWAMTGTNGMHLDQTASRFYSEFTCPTLPDYEYRALIMVQSAEGAYLHLGECTLLDLTAMGA